MYTDIRIIGYPAQATHIIIPRILEKQKAVHFMHIGDMLIMSNVYMDDRIEAVIRQTLEELHLGWHRVEVKNYDYYAHQNNVQE